MAGGKGTRLYPYTAHMPKPLMPVGDYPILEIVLRQLHASGIRDVVLIVNHLHHLIRSFFGDGRDLGLRIDYFIEDTPLGTCGGLGSIVNRLSPDFLLMNGDLLTNLSLKQLTASHAKTDAAVTIAAFQRRTNIDFGVIHAGPDNLVRCIEEKPQISHLVSMGIYVLKRDLVRRFLVPGIYKDMPGLINELATSGERVASYSEDCIWFDIGNPDDYSRSQSKLAENPALFLPDSAVTGAAQS